MRQHTFLKFATRILTAVLSITPLAVVGTAHAQTEVLQANVPFAFESGDTHFAAGTYRIHLSASSPVMRIEGTKSSALQLIMVDSSAHSSNVSKIVFDRYGSRYILKQLWVAGRKDYVCTHTSKAEKQLKLEQARAAEPASRNDLALVATSR